MFDDYSKNYSKEHSEIERIFSNSLPEELDKIFEGLIENFSKDETHHASRKASGMCLDSLGLEFQNCLEVLLIISIK